MEGHNCTTCPQLPLYIWTNYVLENIATPTFCVVGLLGNIVAIIILRNPRMKSTFHQSLVALAACDIMFLSLILIDFAEDILYPFYAIIFPYFINPMKNILLCWETFLIMSITTERYLAVCHPLLYRSHKLSHVPHIHLLTYILPSVFLAIILNIPKFFETELVLRNITDDEKNITRQIYDYAITPVRLDPAYVYYYTHLTRLICTGIIPFFYLLFMNISILINIRRSRLTSTKMLILYTLPAVVQNRVLKNRRHISKKFCVTLGAIVVLYLVCNTPRLLLNFFDHFSSSLELYDYCKCSVNPVQLETLILLSHLFLTINSSVNFIIYFTVSKKFKKVVLAKLKFLILKKRNRVRFEIEDSQIRGEETTKLMDITTFTTGDTRA